MQNINQKNSPNKVRTHIGYYATPKSYLRWSKLTGLEVVTVAKGMGGSKDTSKNESPLWKSRSSDRFEKAMQVVGQLRVKEHVFLSSGRMILTVVGHEGDVYVSIDKEGKWAPYCSCDDFHFRVLNGEIQECYHLMAAKIALDKKAVSVAKFSDDEYELFLNVLLKDVFSRI
ncbi:MAG TPA: hypothetical protein VJN71_10760 [Nitrososphaerales archaeon]|nr:hypothetical protein [Nitrososphaerales archaeon]